MPSDSAPDSALSTLEARLARLRPTAPLATQLTSLSPPTSPPSSIPITTKNPPADIESYLSSFSPPTSSPSPTTDRRLNAALASYEALVPAFTPIEVSFHAPAGAHERTEEEDEMLMARMRDELSVEREVERREEGGMTELERRFEKLKGFTAASGSGQGVGGKGEGEDSEGMGAPPRAVGLEEFERAGSGSDAESVESKDSEESRDSEDSRDSEEEEDGRH